MYHINIKLLKIDLYKTNRYNHLYNILKKKSERNLTFR